MARVGRIRVMPTFHPAFLLRSPIRSAKYGRHEKVRGLSQCQLIALRLNASRPSKLDPQFTGGFWYVALTTLGLGQRRVGCDECYAFSEAVSQ